ncbi:hypothetical protein BKA69DRAFT_1077561 [Paraphysoderma sedebokerense]|nr:hypothetical protein BKA69DRAFT_1077561 [Paraphysoderma sedebokerense]
MNTTIKVISNILLMKWYYSKPLPLIYTKCLRLVRFLDCFMACPAVACPIKQRTHVHLCRLNTRRPFSGGHNKLVKEKLLDVVEVWKNSISTCQHMTNPPSFSSIDETTWTSDPVRRFLICRYLLTVSDLFKGFRLGEKTRIGGRILYGDFEFNVTASAEEREKVRLDLRFYARLRNTLAHDVYETSFGNEHDEMISTGLQRMNRLIECLDYVALDT